MQLCGSLSILWHCLSLGLEWKLTFSSPVATAVFQICWHIECSTFTASSFRIWNSSTGIPSPPLALFVVMLSKAHSTSHSRMCGSRWVITHIIVVIWIFFLYSSSVYSCHLFLLSSASVGSIPFLSLIMPIYAWNVPLVSLIFLKRSLVFPILFFFSIIFALITEERFLISPCSSLELCIQMVISFLFSFAFASLLFSAICKASSDKHFAFLHFFFLGMVLITASCIVSQTSGHSSSGTLYYQI